MLAKLCTDARRRELPTGRLGHTLVEITEPGRTVGQLHFAASKPHTNTRYGVPSFL